MFDLGVNTNSDLLVILARVWREFGMSLIQSLTKNLNVEGTGCDQFFFE